MPDPFGLLAHDGPTITYEKEIPHNQCLRRGTADGPSASTALAEIVYVTSTCSNVTSTTICEVNINNDYNETTWYKVYEEGSGLGGSFTSAKSTTPDKPLTPGARYWSYSWTNSTPDLGVIISPSLAVPAECTSCITFIVQQRERQPGCYHRGYEYRELHTLFHRDR